MDKTGTLRQSPPDKRVVSEIRRAERWIKEILARGGTLPEAMWDIQMTLNVAADNVRLGMWAAKKKASRSRKNK